MFRERSKPQLLIRNLEFFWDVGEHDCGLLHLICVLLLHFKKPQKYKLYLGQTSNLKERLKSHNNGEIKLQNPTSPMN